MMGTTTPPQRVSRSPSIIINERDPEPGGLPALASGKALSLFTISEPYSLRLPGTKRVGVWSLAAGIAALVFGVGLGAFVFAGGDESDAAAIALNLDSANSLGLDGDGVLSGPKNGSPNAALASPPTTAERVAQVIESEDPPSAAGANPAAPSRAGEPPAVAGGQDAKPSSPGRGKSAPSGPAFDKAAAGRALSSAAGRAARCKPAGGPSGTGQVKVTYSTSGSVKTVAVLSPRFKGNASTASCLQMVFRGAKVPAFGGSEVTMTRNFTVP
jgi:hypothetical protein